MFYGLRIELDFNSYHNFSIVNECIVTSENVSNILYLHHKKETW